VTIYIGSQNIRTGLVENKVMFKNSSMLVSSSLSSTSTCAPDEAPAVVCCAGIEWGTSMPLMQLQRNVSHRALLRILCKENYGNIINLMIHYDGLGKYKPCLPRQKHGARCGMQRSLAGNLMRYRPCL
jgi:hypothetical protein